MLWTICFNIEVCRHVFPSLAGAWYGVCLEVPAALRSSTPLEGDSVSSKKPEVYSSRLISQKCMLFFWWTTTHLYEEYKQQAMSDKEKWTHQTYQTFFQIEKRFAKAQNCRGAFIRKTPFLGRWSNLTNIFFRWVVQSPARKHLPIKWIKSSNLHPTAPWNRGSASPGDVCSLPIRCCPFSLIAKARHLVVFGCHLSKEQMEPGCLGYIVDEILPSHVGIIIKPLEGSRWNNQYNGTQDIFFVVIVSNLPKLVLGFVKGFPLKFFR